MILLPTGPLAFWIMAATVVFEISLGSRVDTMARLRLAGRRVVELYKKTAVLVLNVLVCFVCLELVSGGLVRIRGALGHTEEELVLDARSTSSYYASQDWAPVYWREFGLSRRQSYHPYVLWRRHAFSGQTVNVDDNGIRLTPGATCGPGAFKVFVLGGSTVWGTGSPDWGTLPAYLQAELQSVSGGGPVCVVNLGESAYVSTQSTLQLLLQLQSGNVPNLVISYEGPNDVYSAYQSGKSGVHENLEQLVGALEGRKAVEQSASGRLMRATSFFQVTEDLLQKVTRSPQPPAPPQLLTYQTMGVDERALTAAVVQIYLANYDIVDGLARKYGFDYRFFWPPYIGAGRKPLNAEERALADSVDPALDRLYQSAYRAIAAAESRYPRLSNLTGVFDTDADLIWLDAVHVTPSGNRLLAAKILEVLRADPQTLARLKRSAEASSAR